MLTSHAEGVVTSTAGDQQENPAEFRRGKRRRVQRSHWAGRQEQRDQPTEWRGCKLTHSPSWGRPSLCTGCSQRHSPMSEAFVPRGRRRVVLGACSCLVCSARPTTSRCFFLPYIALIALLVPPVKEALAGKTQLSLPVHQVRFCFSLTHKYTHSPQSGSNPQSLKTASYGFLTK